MNAWICMGFEVRKTAATMMADMFRFFFQGEKGLGATYMGNNRVLLKCAVKGKIIAYYLEADDRLLAPWFIVSGRYETDVTNFLAQSLKSDSVCIDVGANFGYFTCLMARFCPKGHVVGMEPDEHVFDLLRDNIAINGFTHARAVHAAAADGDGDITLYRRQSRSGNTSIIRMGEEFTSLLAEKVEVPFSVKTVCIDKLNGFDSKRVDFIKIDVEGAEPLVLRGARQTIENNPKIKIVMEWSPGQISSAGFSIDNLCHEIEALGLRAFKIRPYSLGYIPFGVLAKMPYQAGIVLKR